MNHIPIDLPRLVKLTSSLARIEDRLQLRVNGHNTAMSQSEKQHHLSLIHNSKIPDHMNWTVKIWHFGQDGLTSYSGEKFDITWEDSLNVLHHIYSKDFKKTMKIRDEVQEYPNKSLEEAFMDKLKEGDNTFSVGI
jgi:hypothetical protein